MTHSLFTRHGSPVAEDKVLTPADAKGAGTYRATKACHRCGGAGGSDAWARTGWTCYECGGRGTWPVVEKCYTSEKLAKLNATQAKAAAKRQAAADAEYKVVVAARRERFAEWLKINGPAADNVTADAPSRHVGEVGQRIELELTVEHIVQLEAFCYGAPPSAIFICRDAAGNRIIYKGSAWLADKGYTVLVRATIKEHGERNGELQTVISRPAPPKA